jgi:hypothetical protein
MRSAVPREPKIAIRNKEVGLIEPANSGDGDKGCMVAIAQPRLRARA